MNYSPQRSKKRDGYAVMKALRAREWNFSKVAKAVGVSPQLARETAHGKKNNRKVLLCMLNLGLSAKLLRLPPDMLETGLEVAT